MVIFGIFKQFLIFFLELKYPKLPDVSTLVTNLETRPFWHFLTFFVFFLELKYPKLPDVSTRPDTIEPYKILPIFWPR